MIIELTNTSARVAESTADEFAWLDGFLTYQEKDKVVMIGGETSRVAQRPTRLLNLNTHTFAAGLIGRVVDQAARDRQVVRVDDQRKIPGGSALLERARARAAAIVADPKLGAEEIGDVPFAHQAVAAERALRRTRGIIEIPTGGGKAHLIALLGQLYPVRWVVFVPSRDLLDQTAARWERLTGLPSGRIGDGEWAPNERFTVATFQGMDARLRVGDPEASEWIQSVEAIGVDEAHTLTGSTFYWVAQRTRSAFLRIGFSATPVRGLARDIYSISATGDLIYRITPQQLHELGLVAYPRIRAIRVVQSARVTQWATAHDQLVLRGDPRNLAIALRCKAALAAGEVPGLVLVDKTEHGESLVLAFAKLGMTVPLVHGKTKKSYKAEVLAGLRARTTPVAIATGVWGTGVDIPELRFVFRAAGGKSMVSMIQGLGRGMRVTPSKSTFSAYDVADTGCKWLENHWRQRKAEYGAAGYEVEIEG